MKRSRAQRAKKKKSSPVPFPPRKPRQKFVWLHVLPDDLWIKVRRGKTIWEALQHKDIDLPGDCGGLGKCGKCKVKVLSYIGAPSPEGQDLLTAEELKQGIRLACRNKLRRDLVIQVGESGPELEFHQILKVGHMPPLQLDPLIDKRLITLTPSSGNGLSDLQRIREAIDPECRELKASLQCLRSLPTMMRKTEYHGAAVVHDGSLLAWQNWEEGGRRYGLVFDLGTSTLVGKLISLLDGTEIAAISRINSQVKYGTNVISRLQYVAENATGLNRLHELLIKDLSSIAGRLLEVGGLSAQDMFIVVVAGNTTMQHLLLGVNPVGIARAPFSPVVTDGLIIKAAEVGLKLHPEALLYVMPAKSGYVGGDLISVILASDILEQDDGGIVLGLDLGTNGEIFLGSRHRMLTCSAAAGPALEGAKISHGMIAKAGAIEAVGVVDGRLHCNVIGNIKPKGICGSGLVDLIAVLLHVGVIDHEGLIHPQGAEGNSDFSDQILFKNGAHGFVIASELESAHESPIILTQRDVRELQLAKAAVAAGIGTLMRVMEIGPEDIRHVYLAGALGNYLNPYSAMRIGLIPHFRPEIIKSLGNAASTGAAMVLLSKSCWQSANSIADFVEHVELSSQPGFNESFVEQMNFPRENIW